MNVARKCRASICDNAGMVQKSNSPSPRVPDSFRSGWIVNARLQQLLGVTHVQNFYVRLFAGCLNDLRLSLIHI